MKVCNSVLKRPALVTIMSAEYNNLWILIRLRKAVGFDYCNIAVEENLIFDIKRRFKEGTLKLF